MCATSSHTLKFISIGFCCVCMRVSLFVCSTRHNTQYTLIGRSWRRMCAFSSTWCPHFYFTLTILSIVEKWSHHIDLTKTNRHILRVVYAHCMTNEKRMPKELHQIQEKTKLTHTNSRTANVRRKKEKCKSFAKWPKLGKVFSLHTTYECSNGFNTYEQITMQ